MSNNKMPLHIRIVGFTCIAFVWLVYTPAVLWLVYTVWMLAN